MTTIPEVNHARDIVRSAGLAVGPERDHEGFSNCRLTIRARDTLLAALDMVDELEAEVERLKESENTLEAILNGEIASSTWP